jgi:hydrogenase maturation protease
MVDESVSTRDPEKADQPTAEAPRGTVVLGVGNLLLSDEGLGVHVANRLMEMDLPPGVEVVEGGVDGLYLIDVVLRAKRLIVVDAVKGGALPGSIYRFGPDEFDAHPDAYTMSMHEIGILEAIRISGLVGDVPETTIIGVEPKSMEPGMELTPEIRSRIPRIIELVLQEVGSAS